MSYLLYKSAWLIIRWLPERSAYRLGESIAQYALKKNGKGVIRLRENLRIVLPELSAKDLEKLLKKSMASYSRYWIDTFRFPGWSLERLRQSVRTTNRETFDRLLGQGRGLIVALPHAGNWDHAGAFFCGEGHPLVTVAEHLKPERLFREFLRYREAMGMEVLDLDSQVITTLETRARQGRLIALVADRDLSRTGIEVNLFGRKAKLPGGPAKIAIATGAPLITAYISYEANGIHVQFSDEIPTENRSILEITQSIADNFAHDIYRDPEDWHMLQRVFIDRDFELRD
ncbi:MAG: phosphatidylinositol mannoside acyltransferase [Actinobacteria bacterium]|nr:phosphatidylinositol mannoside acyltransferase [Actinomycetota bacterium]MDA2985129.1 phosphatidylinositol mannoside acyltransferase [Actinomycetota bacterium]